MKNRQKTKANGKRKRVLTGRLATLEAAVDTARKRAHEAKAQFKSARKALKQAKKSLKHARKLAGSTITTKDRDASTRTKKARKVVATKTKAAARSVR